MSNEFSKLRHEHRQVEETHSIQRARQAREFSSVEEMIRADREQTEIPPALAERVKESLKHEPKPAKPWWKRIFVR